MTDASVTAAPAAAATVTPMVEAVGVSKSFGSNEVLKSISLRVMPGEVLCLVGPAECRWKSRRLSAIR